MHTAKPRFNHCIVVDLDYTLVSIDTTAKLVEVRCPWKYRLLSLMFSALKPLMLLMNKMLNRDLYKLMLLRTCFKKCREPVLDDVIETIYREIEKSGLNNSLLKILEKADGIKILLTASIDDIAKKFSRFSFDLVISSVIECREEELYSFLDLYKRKHVILKHLLKYCNKIFIIEDSPEPQYKSLERVKVIQVIHRGRR